MLFSTEEWPLSKNADNTGCVRTTMVMEAIRFNRVESVVTSAVDCTCMERFPNIQICTSED